MSMDTLTTPAPAVEDALLACQETLHRDLPRSLEDVRALYCHPSCFHFLGLTNWLPNIEFFCNAPTAKIGTHADQFHSRKPNEDEDLTDAAQTLRLLNSYTPNNNARTREDTFAFFRVVNETIETKCSALGLNLGFPKSSLRNHFENKLNLFSIAQLAGVPVLPQVTQPLHDYADLQRLTDQHGWDKFVVQLPLSHSGSGTFFISSKDDFESNIDEISSHAEVKISPTMNLESYALEACITSKGVSVSPLVLELTGDSNLTPFSAGWCGNQICSENRGAKFNKLAQGWADSIGKVMAASGYRGLFGLDFLRDRDTDTLYLGEINARVTGISPLLMLADRYASPLILEHILEFSNLTVSEPSKADYKDDVFGQLMFMYKSAEPGVFDQGPKLGIYELQDGVPRFVRPSMNPHEIEPNQAFFLLEKSRGNKLVQGDVMGRLMLHEAIVDSDKVLTERAQQWIQGINALISHAPKNYRM